MEAQIRTAWVCAGFTGLFLAGCAVQPVAAPPYPDLGQMTPAGYPPAGYAAYNNIEPAAGPALQGQPGAAQAAMPSAPAATAYPALVDPVMAQRTAALQAELAKSNERLDRVEKAMLRLDRRMQLVEKSELGRMNTASAEGDATQSVAQADTGADPADSPDAMPAKLPVSGPRAGYGDGFQPVSTPITSALQAAPIARAPDDNVAIRSTAVVASGRLPSLADPVQTSSRAPTGDERLAIWTVKYDTDKVWPERDQLPSSRDVVNLLRQGTGGGQVTVFARGPQPNSREFRERVKAISRYLAKVTSLDSVPIAALAAPHLDPNTIEIFASP